jgi:hypothetical protein
MPNKIGGLHSHPSREIGTVCAAGAALGLGFGVVVGLADGVGDGVGVGVGVAFVTSIVPVPVNWGR